MRKVQSEVAAVSKISEIVREHVANPWWGDWFFPFDGWGETPFYVSDESVALNHLTQEDIADLKRLIDQTETRFGMHIPLPSHPKMTSEEKKAEKENQLRAEKIAKAKAEGKIDDPQRFKTISGRILIPQLNRFVRECQISLLASATVLPISLPVSAVLSHVPLVAPEVLSQAPFVAPSAQAGNPQAQYALGSLYDLGQEGLPQTEEKAVFWWKKSAKKNASSAYALALCYQFGEGVQMDAQKAQSYNHLASDLGSPEGALAMGLSYQLGKGVAKNGSEAFKYYKLAAKRGNIEGEILLGNAYLEGLGGQKNAQKAAEIWKQAAEHHNAEAQRLLGALYVEGADDFPVNLDKGRYWLEKSAQQGNAKAQYQLGGIYENSDLPDHQSLALTYYQKASANGTKLIGWGNNAKAFAIRVCNFAFFIDAANQVASAV
ncbi:tpr repeat sel1 subfamily [Lasius niger]|uniref:Tpr repeat sel1 subfamily n=1 Tax=Lasius niger TaxID=67767 RepID=A0A0J7KE49_LASNI|nr:tpr repeat sel1 subfamily [Lasius niger]